ncbi:MAG: ParB N-terminal domain-containing protein [Nitrospirales bacterium]|nr:ParB N-terminal domain-containing protein [Nitrospirales bacterium]
MVEDEGANLPAAQNGDVLAGSWRERVEIIGWVNECACFARVSPYDLLEQDVNARVMDEPMFLQLMQNVKTRGWLESVPFCAVTERGIEIVSGHHRVRAARGIGMEAIPVLLDVSGLSREEIAAKQLAHNNLNGATDSGTERKIAETIRSANLLLEAYLDKRIDLKPEPVDLEGLVSARVVFEWKRVMLAFLPHQFTAFQEVANATVGTVDCLGVVPLECFEPFRDALAKVQRVKNVSSVGTMVAWMIELMQEEIAKGIDLEQLEREVTRSGGSKWVDLDILLGSNKIPSDAGVIIKKAIKRMIEKGEVQKTSPWKAVEYWAIDYLNGLPAEESSS